MFYFDELYLDSLAGSPTDNMINALLPLLDDEDILIDGGNTNYQDT
jgi:6-phosphogluconate dehydrogenase